VLESLEAADAALGASEDVATVTASEAHATSDRTREAQTAGDRTREARRPSENDMPRL
jgi:hypothetical protein